MKKLTEEEVNALMTKPIGRVSHVRVQLLHLQPGEYLLIEKKDWTWTTATPSVMCRRLERRSTLKYDCKRVSDGSGWVVKREK